MCLPCSNDRLFNNIAGTCKESFTFHFIGLKALEELTNGILIIVTQKALIEDR